MGGRGSWSRTAEQERISLSGGSGNENYEKIHSSGFQGMKNGRASSDSTARQAEEKITKNSYETGVIIDGNGFVIAAYKGGAHSVGFSDGKGNNDYQKLAGNTITHNHPSGSAVFSFNDVALASAYNVKEIRAATRSKGTAVLTANNRNSKWKDFEAAYKNAFPGLATVKSAQDWYKKNAPKYGLAFRLEK